MKKTIITNLKYIAFGLVLATLASYAHASWGGPLTNTYVGSTAPFPNNTIATTINVGPIAQVKEGSLSLGGWFMALADGQIDGATIFASSIHGGASTDMRGTLTVGAVGTPTHMAVGGGLSNTAYTVQSTPLANADYATVCANETGTLVLCDAASTPPPAIPPPPAATTIIDMYVNEFDQTGTFQTIKSNATGSEYRIDMGGQNTGLSLTISVPAGSYTILQSDVMCTNGGVLRSPLFGEGFIVNDGEYYTVRYVCA